ncbi:MAG: hypothetical protein WB586_16045 [Chthoniobacterales bacterium]
MTDQQPMEQVAPVTTTGTEEESEFYKYDRPEPFATILELIEEHGREALLQSIADAAFFDSVTSWRSDACRAKCAWLYPELEQLLERMRQFEDALE